MLRLKYSEKMKKYLKTCQKRKCDMVFFEQIVDKLLIPESLNEKNKYHNLTGNYKGFKECHIQPDWLLIYRQTDECLELVRTDTYSGLFGK